MHQLDTLQSTPLVANGRYMKTGLDMISPISRIPESSFIPESSQNRNELPSSCTGITDNETQSSSMYSFKDVSTWIGGKYCNESIIPCNFLSKLNFDFILI